MLGGLISEIYFLTILEARSLGQGLVGVSLLRLLSLPCRRPSSSVLTLLSFDFVACVLISSFYRHTSYMELGATHITLVYLNYFFKGTVSKFNHVLRYWGLGLLHMNFEGDTVELITVLFRESVHFREVVQFMGIDVFIASAYFNICGVCSYVSSFVLDGEILSSLSVVM